jgi:RND family efflux transporter MFP subunit
MVSFSRTAFLGFAALLTVAADAPPRPVRVQPVVLTPSEQNLTYSGVIAARVQADLAFRVGGKIIERLVNPGEGVKAGQVIARLDPADLRISLASVGQSVASAEADAMNARADMQRYERLGRASPAFLPSEYDRRQATLLGAEARLAQARHQLALARDQLTYAELRADADGVITAVPIQVGQVVQAGQTIAGLAHSAEIEAVVDVPENRLPDIRESRSIAVTLWSAPQTVLHGRLREVGALADASSRTFAVRITVLDPPPGGLPLGATAAVRFARNVGAPVALLPSTALIDQDGKPAVWVLDPKAEHAALRQVQVAAILGDDLVAISAGLQPGEQVVTAGAHALRPDMRLAAWPGAVH